MPETLVDVASRGWPLGTIVTKAIERLRELHGSADPEGAHALADEVLCDLLNAIGYAGVVDAWQKVPRWYA